MLISNSTSAELVTAPISRRSSSPEGRLAILVLSAQERVAGNLAGLAERLGEELGLFRGENESNGSFVGRLLQAIGRVPKEERIALGRQLAQLVKGLRLETVISPLRNPAGLEAARTAMALETSAGNDPDPVVGRVVSSYRQNGDQISLSTRPAPASDPHQVSPPIADSPEGSGAKIDKADATAPAKAMLQQGAEPVRGTTAAAPSAGNIEGTATREELPGRASEYGPVLSDGPPSRAPSAASTHPQLSLPQTDAERTEATHGQEPGERSVSDDGSVRDRSVRRDHSGMRTTVSGARSAIVEVEGTSPVMRHRPPERPYTEGRDGVLRPGLNTRLFPLPAGLEELSDALDVARLLSHLPEHEGRAATGHAEMPNRTPIAAAEQDHKAATSVPVPSLSEETGGDESREVRSQSVLSGDVPAPPPGSTEGRLPAAMFLRDNPAFPFFGYTLFEDDTVSSGEETKRGRGDEQDGNDDRRGEDGSEDQPGSGETSGSEGNGENDVDEDIGDEAIADPASALGSETVLAHYLTMSTLT
ncbi:MAG TPA: hypothetical protein VK181_17285 [Rhizobium sp.]|nr:hypothetical protein [Rhizobium sp.]